MSEASGKDRRKHPRVPYGAWVEDISQATLRFFLAKNLSLGGMLLQADDPPAIGSNVRLKLIVENEKQTMAVEGQVVRHATDDKGNPIFAIKFFNLDQNRLAFLKELMDEVTELKE